MDNETQNLQKSRYYVPKIKKMRFFLMIFAILYTYGLHSRLQDFNVLIFGFAFPALYVISGYVVLWESEDIEKRILRTIGRTAICFAVMFVSYFALSLLADKSGTLALLASKSFWFDFLALNICALPIGSTIWFVQGLLYAYIIIYFIYKLKLLKLDIYIAVLCLAVTLFTGELSSFVGFRLFWHTYISGNFLTRALPYILIGCFIHRKEEILSNIFDSLKIVTVIGVGGMLTILEYLALSLSNNKVYVSHLLGMGIMAVGISFFCFFGDKKEKQLELLNNISRHEMMIPFFVCSPIYYLTVKLLKLDKEVFERLNSFAGIITLILSIAVLYLYHHIVTKIYSLKYRNYEKSESDDVIDFESAQQAYTDNND